MCTPQQDHNCKSLPEQLFQALNNSQSLKLNMIKVHSTKRVKQGAILAALLFAVVY